MAEYIRGLPSDRRAALGAVRGVILDRLPEGYEEAMNWGMICYQVPLSTVSDTYNGQPLMYAALASQRRHMAVYLSGIYADEESRAAFESAYRATGKRYDVGKSCVRFRKLDDLPLDVVGDAIASLEVDEFVDLYQRGRSTGRTRTDHFQLPQRRTSPRTDSPTPFTGSRRRQPPRPPPPAPRSCGCGRGPRS